MKALRVAILVAGCGGESYVLLEVHGELAIPAQMNSIEVVAVAYDTGEVLTDLDLRLESDQEYPIAILLEPAADTPSSLEVRALGRKDGVPAADSAAVLRWQEDEIVRVDLRLRPL